MSPKREFGPFEVCLGSDINDNIIDINDQEKNNLSKENQIDNNTLNQNFYPKEKNSIINQNNILIKSQNNMKSPDSNIIKEFSKNTINENQDLIKSYDYIKNKKEDNINKNENEENQFIDYLKEAMSH